MDLLRRWMFTSNGRAVTAVFLGAIGIVGFGVILGPITVGLGVIALTELAGGRRPSVGDPLAAFTLALVLASR